jgi:hypothetical protein
MINRSALLAGRGFLRERNGIPIFTRRYLAIIRFYTRIAELSGCQPKHLEHVVTVETGEKFKNAETRLSRRTGPY